jgi:hypothetical protein
MPEMGPLNAVPFEASKHEHDGAEEEIAEPHYQGSLAHFDHLSFTFQLG